MQAARAAVQRQVLWTTSASHALIHVFELAIPPLMILIQRDLGAGDFAMGTIVGLTGLLFGLGALPAGALADRLGAKPLLLSCLWGGAVCLAGMGLSPSLPAFAACAAALGLCLSIYHPAGTSLLSQALPLSGRVFATHGMAGNVGVAASSAIAGALGYVLGWRWALGVLALAGLGLGVVASTLPAPGRREVHEPARGGHWPQFLLLLAAAAFLGMVYRGMTTFLPKYFATSGSATDERAVAWAGLLTTLALAAGVLGMYVAGRAVDAGARPARVFLAGAAVQVPFLAALGWLGGLALLPLAMGVAFFHFLTQPPGNHMVAGFTPPRLRGLGYGVYFLATFGGGSLGANLGGFVSERFALSWVFPALAAVALPAVTACLVLVRATRR